MQDRYAGDVGDFLKLGLLRWLTAADDQHQGLSLGMLWYLTVDESHNDDGKHISYTDPTTPVGRSLERLDPDLHRRLATMVLIERSVAELERSGALPAGTRTFSERLDMAGVAPAERERFRAEWLQRALDALGGCDVVFADPDNGIRPDGHSVPRHHPKSVKHAYVDELGAFADRGQALVVYHHADRSAKVELQAQRRLGELAAVAEPIAAVRASRGTVRLFLVAGSGPIADRLVARLSRLEDSAWNEHLDVIWHDPAVVSAEARPARSASVDRVSEFSDECLRIVSEVAALLPTVHTVADERPNQIVEVRRSGILVHTEKSRREGSPQEVPAWMVEVAWEHLRRTGRLAQSHLVATDGLNVKRSAFVVALLAHFPGVRVVSTRPSELSFEV